MSALPARPGYPLSYGQACWCGWPGSFSPGFVICHALRVRGRLELGALQAALDNVVRRHEALRTVVYENSDALDEGWQIVHAGTAVPMNVVDAPVDVDRDAHAANLLRDTSLTSIDPTRPPLLRAEICRFDAEDHVLVMASHHTACDGWSWDIVNRDLVDFYRARLSGADPDLPAAVQFQEFTTWQRDRLGGERGAALAQFWRDELGDTEIFALVRVPPPQPPDHSAHTSQNFTLAADMFHGIEALALAERTSVVSLLLAAFHVVAREISGVTDNTVTTMTSGRPTRRFHDSVGPFMDFLPVRIDMADAVTFRDVLRLSRSNSLRALGHGAPQLFLERALPGLMRPVTSEERIDVVFGYERPTVNQPVFGLADGAVRIPRPASADSGAPGGFVWTVGVLDDGAVAGRVQFDPTEFDSHIVSRWVQRYLDVMATAIADPDVEWRLL